MSQPLVELRNAQARYGDFTALHDINLTIHAGERIALVGASGSGKSTLLDLIHQHSQQPSALVPQDFGLVRTLSVYHNLYMGALDRHSTWYNLVNLLKPFAARIDEIRLIAEKLGLGEKLFQAVGNLSGGQRQRVAVGRALYQGGAIVLADEPVSALDQHHSSVVLDRLAYGFTTSVLGMHDIELALSYSNRVIGLQDGRIVLDQASDSLTTADITPLYSTDSPEKE